MVNFSHDGTVIRVYLLFQRFKLHLRSKIGAGRSVGGDLAPLPLDKTVVEVFADFLR